MIGFQITNGQEEDGSGSGGNGGSVPRGGGGLGTRGRNICLTNGPYGPGRTVRITKNTQMINGRMANVTRVTKVRCVRRRIRRQQLQYSVADLESHPVLRSSLQRRSPK
ncbi:hypothetical protein HDE_11884 [Halotydeus destructor]|nr:hypothetical protein HDE_11884 [Halotydeus destructor]